MATGYQKYNGHGVFMLQIEPCSTATAGVGGPCPASFIYVNIDYYLSTRIHGYRVVNPSASGLWINYYNQLGLRP